MSIWWLFYFWLMAGPYVLRVTFKPIYRPLNGYYKLHPLSYYA